MTHEDAVDRMELVGHDFFLFIDARTDRPSVVYRRKGWDYGVIGLETPPTSSSASRPLAEVAARPGSRRPLRLATAYALVTVGRAALACPEI